MLRWAMLVYRLDVIMQIRLSELEVADTLNPLVRYVLAGGRRSMAQNLTDCYLRDVSGGLEVWGTSCSLLQHERQVTAL